MGTLVRLVVLLCAAGLTGCADPPDLVAAPDLGAPDAAHDLASEAGTDGGPDGGLPITFTRADVGTPLSPAELAAATDELIALLADTRYFDFVDERVHGWPASDGTHAFWYGSWWSGVRVKKSGGAVTFQHAADGADNNGLRTAPYLEGACYAHLLWGRPLTADLVRRMARGFAVLALGMKTGAGDPNPTLLARALYPTSVASTDGGRSLFIDYDLDRPGLDAPPSSYVHLPNNPTLGDLYVKNKRSKDDMGHVLRSIVQLRPCRGVLGTDGQADLDQVDALYRSWAQRVDAQGFVIETLDPDGALWSPPDQLAHYILTANLECLGALAVRLFGGAPAGTLDCGDGFTMLESAAWTIVKNDLRQIMRTHHAAAITAAYRIGELALASSLMAGLARRVDLDVGLVTSGSPPSGFEPRDVASELIYAMNVGLPLTSAEVRWLHARLHQAYVAMRDPSNALTLHVFDGATPDGEYDYEIPDEGLFHLDLGMMLGACASPNRNPAGRALLDCAKLAAAF